LSLDIYLMAEVDAGGAEPHQVELYWANITHNVASMWQRAGCFEALYKSEGKAAADILPALERAEGEMRREPGAYRALDPSNGWGSYDSALEWLGKLIAACRRHPKAVVRVSV
jgi:hypothetical protein